MAVESFTDYYELLQVSSNADEDTIHRVFRHLAKKYHPDVPGHGDARRFNLLVEAHRTLTEPEARAAYDVRHQHHWKRTWAVASEAADDQLFVDDAAIRERLLALLYIQRRRSVRQPGMGEMDLARVVGSPPEHIDFHLWYLKEKGWSRDRTSGVPADLKDFVTVGNEIEKWLKPAAVLPRSGALLIVLQVGDGRCRLCVELICSSFIPQSKRE